jgi:predicted nucleic acid-binding protein
MPLSRYLIDTNILLRLSNPLRESHLVCKDALRHLRSTGCSLHYTLQNAAEYWNVATRPTDRNGHGLSPTDVAEELNGIERVMSLLADDAEVYNHWRSLVTKYSVRGVQVHDARLAASMLAHNIPNILTLNISDFSRYQGITAVHPAHVKP